MRPVCHINKSIGYGKKMYETLRVEKDAIGVSMKQGSILKLNDFVNPIMCDQDYTQDIEDEYRRKHDQTFCWKFLRAVSYLDPASFQDKRMQVFDGNVEYIA